MCFPICLPGQSHTNSLWLSGKCRTERAIILGTLSESSHAWTEIYLNALSISPTWSL